MNSPSEFTTQEIFDRVVDHLLKQNKRATRMVDRDEYCAYLSPSGDKCAVGCLISDGAYHSGLEGNLFIAANGVVIRAVETSIGRSLTEREKDLLSTLQSVHDCTAAHRWPDNLAKVAARYDLKFKGGPSGHVNAESL